MLAVVISVECLGIQELHGLGVALARRFEAPLSLEVLSYKCLTLPLHEGEKCEGRTATTEPDILP